MRDPRNWVRPAAAVVAGSAAGAALVLLRARRRTGAQAPDLQSMRATADGVREGAERALRDLGRETRKLFGDR
jgi:uncharacterized protein (DUF849 family)